MQDAVDMANGTRRKGATVSAARAQERGIEFVQVDGAELLNANRADVWLDVQP
jgi:hypothetical protein